LDGEVDETFLAGVGVAAAIARTEADAVDRESRFPAEAVAALRDRAALGAALPPALGGRGVTFAALCAACVELARNCAATGMTFAMHQIQVASIARHVEGSDWLTGYLGEVARGERLIASATSEVGGDGDLRQSVAPLEPAGDGRVRFEKRAATVSYGAYADDLLVTLRRSPDAERGDQILILARAGEVALEQIGDWDALGMRGTCGPGFGIAGELDERQVVPVPFGTIAAETMVPYAHILWAHCWLGIASDAAARVRALAHTRARRGVPETAGSGARRSRLVAQLAGMRAVVGAALAEYEAIKDLPEREELSTLGYATRINALKTLASDAAVEICIAALAATGLAGYRNATEYSVGRNLRDALSAPLMVANDRIHATNAALLLMHDGT
jgi:acyl-CoA dehydrogenase